MYITVLFQDHKLPNLKNMKCPVKRLLHPSGITGQVTPCETIDMRIYLHLIKTKTKQPSPKETKTNKKPIQDYILVYQTIYCTYYTLQHLYIWGKAWEVKGHRSNTNTLS